VKKRKAVEVIAEKLGFTANAANKITSLHTEYSWLIKPLPNACGCAEKTSHLQ